LLRMSNEPRPTAAVKAGLFGRFRATPARCGARSGCTLAACRLARQAHIKTNIAYTEEPL
jgi:hypothetical protein